MQKMVCEESIIPFIEKAYPVHREATVLEIGCGTAGVLSAFLERGHKGFGVDLDNGSLDYASEKLADYIESKQLTLIYENIYSIDFEEEYQVKFDVIILKDVIEHIPDQEKLLKKMQTFLAPSGVIFMGFPPWQMPFGGHQQICRNKFLSHLPYFHLLPTPIYKGVLKTFKENPVHLCELKETGISIERLEKLAKKTGYAIINKEFYFTNPIYKYKFNVKVRKQAALLRSIPYLRDFYTTCAYYLFQAKKQ
jgi:SAM-dependent methyltransferase